MSKLSFIMTPIPCPKCRDNCINSIATGKLIDENNYSYFKMECQNQHIFWGIPRFPDYCYFLMNGLASFNSGNYFESFSSAYFAYERFKTTFCEAVLLSNDTSQSYEEILNQTQHFRSDSTKVNGAFQALYAMYFHSAAIDISTEDVKKRNRITHGAEAPNERKVKKVFMDIINFIQKTEWKFVSSLSDEERDQGYGALNYPILDLIFSRSNAVNDYLIKKKKVHQDDITFISNNYFYNGKQILPVGNQQPTKPSNSDYKFDDMAKVFNNFQNTHLKVIQNIHNS